MNLYAIVQNSPSTAVDPFGLYHDREHEGELAKYTKEDHCFWTDPHYPWGYGRHFRRRDKVEKDLMNDIRRG